MPPSVSRTADRLQTSPSPSPATDAASHPILQLRDVEKRYGAVRAVDGVSIDVRRGEILTLLGPSGCGKTTTLRIAIGLERCDAGQVVYDGRVLDAPRQRIYVPTHQRDMGIVFQSYAIWPHMTVFDNVAYPLRVRKVPRARIATAVAAVLEQVGLSGVAERPATQLSGGQQQRVALARSLVFEPQILLLDEPFSNLDAHLRGRMRAELKLLQRRLGITVLLVTHDQLEALSLSDRIAVMRAGKLEQLGTPQELYHAPASVSVRDFLGRTILLRGQVERTAAGIVDEDSIADRTGVGAGDADGAGGVEVVVRLAAGVRLVCAGGSVGHVRVGQACEVAVRPEQVGVAAADGASADGVNQLAGSIEALLFVGDRYEATIALDLGQTVLADLPAAAAAWREGQRVVLTLPPAAARVWSG